MDKDKIHIDSLDNIANELKTDFEKGISESEVSNRREKYGENRLEEKKSRTIFQMILDQFKDFLVIILIIASIISIAVGELSDGIVILLIVIINAILGVVQENRASNALKALQEMASPKAKVIRDGELKEIESINLVLGDIVIIESGDYIPADLRLIESNNLKIDESALTGESVAVDKDALARIKENAPIADRINLAYMSTIVTYGRAKGVVVSTGMDTEIGKIAGMLNESKDSQTPLQRKLAEFGKLLGIICIIVCIIIFGLGLIRGQNLLEIFLIAISLAVAAIPEGLPAVVTVVLAMGMQRMVKRNAIIKRLAAVETLGSTTVICTDKTGTLTQNKMTVLEIYDGENEWDITGTGYSFEGEIRGKGSLKDIDMLLNAMVLCNDAEISEEEVIGDPTEGALIVAAAKAQKFKSDLNRLYPRIKEFPFDSDRKLMSTMHNINGRYIMLTKGAPDIVLSRSKKILLNGEIIELTEEIRNRITKKNSEYAESALRVLAFAYKEIEENSNIEEEENQLTFLGLTGMIDPPREEAKEAIKLCKSAGIRVVMITGDHITTASAIGRQIGLLDGNSLAIEGHKIDEYTDEEFKEIVKKTNVFARVSPEHKVRIVDSIKSNNEIVAMTGDGVNDAPSLKRADIGVAMGITGTDVSKEAANMILTDDNFASIVDAVEEGRIIYSNIRKFVGFLLSCNIGEILLIFISMLFGWGTPLLAIQLLWINLITDSLPAFALGLEPQNEEVMNKNPRHPDEPLVDRHMKIAIAFQSIGLALAALISYRIADIFIISGQDANLLPKTFCFVTLIFGEMLRAYSARSEIVPIHKMKILSNRLLNISVILAIGLLAAVVYIPTLQNIFHTVGLSLNQALIAVGLSILPIIAGEISKMLKKAE
ncbi:MAG: calcium-translocating P-type ATPase, SERCA-type [Andreesenia angusta]|nr:calcium-translocating P-type ATPase, SERCA-type [Andreesenia angusta]